LFLYLFIKYSTPATSAKVDIPATKHPRTIIILSAVLSSS
jgi:hypothetical protein